MISYYSNNATINVALKGNLIFLQENIGPQRSEVTGNISSAHDVRGRNSTEFVRHFFIKCSAVHRLLNQGAKAGLQAKWRFLGFARKFQSSMKNCSGQSFSQPLLSGSVLCI